MWYLIVLLLIVRGMYWNFFTENLWSNYLKIFLLMNVGWNFRRKHQNWTNAKKSYVFWHCIIFQLLMFLNPLLQHTQNSTRYSESNHCFEFKNIVLKSWNVIFHLTCRKMFSKQTLFPKYLFWWNSIFVTGKYSTLNTCV